MLLSTLGGDSSTHTKHAGRTCRSAAFSAAREIIPVRALVSPARRSVGSSAVGSVLAEGVLRIYFARSAYLSVPKVSSRLLSSGETNTTSRVRILPPSESCKRQVNLESRYGTWTLRRLVELRAVEDMTFARAKISFLIWTHSAKRVRNDTMRLARSEPSRSTW